MSEKIKDAVLAEAKNTQAVAHDVITSGAYLYPFKVSSYAIQECFPTVSVSDFKWVLGNHLLCDTQRPLAPFYISGRSNYHAWGRRHVRHVLLHVRATDGHYGLH